MEQSRWIPWLTLGLMAAGTAVFYWDVHDAEPVDLVLIRPLVGIAALLLLFVGFQQLRRRDATASTGAVTAPAKLSRQSITTIILLFVLLLGLGTAGFFVPCGLFLVVSMWVLGVRRPMLLLGVPATFLAAVYLLFVQVLGVPFPSSPLGLF